MVDILGRQLSRLMPQTRQAATVILLLISAASPLSASRPTTPSRTPSRTPSQTQFETPSQLLRLLGISDSLVDSVVDGQPLADEDDEALIRILHRMPQIGPDDIARWQQTRVPWPVLAKTPKAERTHFFVLHGRVRQVVRYDLRPQLAALFDFDHYYQVEMEIPDTEYRVTICTRNIPNTWKETSNWDARARASAMFLKAGARASGRTKLYFVARRIAWLPDRVDRRYGIGPSQVLLGDLGMDIGLFDAVRKRNRKGISTAERECFYQLLAAAARARPTQLNRLAKPPDLQAILQQPEKQHGDLLRLHGTICRITKVLVDDPDVRERFGIDHYYQLDALLPLGNRVIEFRDLDGKLSGPVYDTSFPLTFCVARLPPRWSALADQNSINESATFSGFFFKLWAYPNSLVSRHAPRQRQLSPMVIGLEPDELFSAVAPNSNWGILAGIGFLIVLGTLWVIVGRTRKSDQIFEDRLRQRRLQQPDVLPVDSADKRPDGGPRGGCGRSITPRSDHRN